MTLKAWTKSRRGARVLGAVTVVALIAGVEALIRSGVIKQADDVCLLDKIVIGAARHKDFQAVECL